MLLAATKTISRTRSLRCPSHASRGERRGFMQRFGLGVNRTLSLPAAASGPPSTQADRPRRMRAQAGPPSTRGAAAHAPRPTAGTRKASAPPGRGRPWARAGGRYSKGPPRQKRVSGAGAGRPCARADGRIRPPRARHRAGPFLGPFRRVAFLGVPLGQFYAGETPMPGPVENATLIAPLLDIPLPPERVQTVSPEELRRRN